MEPKSLLAACFLSSKYIKMLLQPGLCPRPPWESLQCSLDLPANFENCFAAGRKGVGEWTGRRGRKGKADMWILLTRSLPQPLNLSYATAEQSYAQNHDSSSHQNILQVQQWCDTQTVYRPAITLSELNTNSTLKTGWPLPSTRQTPGLVLKFSRQLNLDPSITGNSTNTSFLTNTLIYV